MGSVTISASYGSRGGQIAQAVAERLGLPFVDRAISQAAASELHLSEESFEISGERAPSRWDRFFGALSAADLVATATGIAVSPSADPDTFRIATEHLLREVADTTGGVILGRAGMVVLGGRSDVVRVRLDGPREARIAQAVADGANPVTARDVQNNVDRACESYASFFYHVRQNDRRLYHLVIDSTALPVNACVDIVIRAAQARS